MPAWTIADIQDQTGRIALVTGATSGIGLVAARALAAKGAEVILAVRDTGRGDSEAAAIRAHHPAAKLTVCQLDLASLASVRDFAERMADTLPRLDLLLNNAGLSQLRARTVTADGFELQLATNYLGPFALTGLLIPILLRAPTPRVVAISSIAAARGRIAFDDLQGATHFNGWDCYSQSKLADLMFALELDRRARQAGSRLVSVAAHPGVATTGFMKASGLPGSLASIIQVFVGLIGQDAEAGALPGLYAATMPQVQGGSFWGPDGWREMRGQPAPAKIPPQAADKPDAARLWAVSEALTGVTYPALI